MATKSPVGTIPMNASEFKDYVANLKSSSLRQKLMPVVRVCSGETALQTETNEETIGQLVQCSNIRAARSDLSDPRREATTESQVSSTKSASLRQKLLPVVRVCSGETALNTESNEETIGQLVQCSSIRAARSDLSDPRREATTESQVSSTQTVKEREFESAKASDIVPTFVKEVQTAKNSVTDLTSVEDVLNDCVGDIDDILMLVASSQNPPLTTQNPQESPSTTVPDSKIEQEQHASAVNDKSSCARALPHEQHQSNEMLTERQENTDVNSNDGSAQCVISSPLDNQVNKIQSIQSGPVTVQGSEREIISSKTSQTFFSAKSAISDGGAQASNFRSGESLQSIEPFVGSEISFESDYLAPWEVMSVPTSSIVPTDAVATSEEMALVTEDFVPESESIIPMDGVEDVISASEAVARASEEILDAMVSDDDSVSSSGSGKISLIDASNVLMQRSKGGCYEEESTGSELSSEEF